MLKYLRKKGVQKKIYIALTVLIVPGFVIWGLSAEGQGPTTFVGTIGAKKIPLRDYLSSYQAVQRENLLRFGTDLPQSAELITGEAWDRLLLLDFAKQQKIKTTDAEVVSWLTGQEAFSRGGRPDTAFYKQFVSERLKTTPKNFEEEIRQMLTIAKIRFALARSATPANPELKAIYDTENGARDIRYALLSLEPFKTGVALPEEKLKESYPLFQERFKTQERVKIRYEFKPKDSEETQSGETAFFARHESIPGLGLIDEVLEKSFSLPVDETSDWLRLDRGSYRVTVTGKEPARARPFDEAKKDLEALLVEEEAKQKTIETLNATKFETKNAEIKTLEKFKKGVYVPGLGPADVILDPVFRLKENETTTAFAARQHAVIVQVTKIWPADEKEFEKEKDDLLKRVAAKRGFEEYENLLKQLRAQGKLDEEVMQKLFAPAQ